MYTALFSQKNQSVDEGQHMSLAIFTGFNEAYLNFFNGLLYDPAACAIVIDFVD